MKTGNKCKECNSCLDITWFGTRRYYFCWFCEEFYDRVDNEFAIIDIQQATGIEKKVLIKQMENYGKR